MGMGGLISCASLSHFYSASERISSHADSDLDSFHSAFLNLWIDLRLCEKKKGDDDDGGTEIAICEVDRH